MSESMGYGITGKPTGIKTGGTNCRQRTLNLDTHGCRAMSSTSFHHLPAVMPPSLDRDNSSTCNAYLPIKFALGGQHADHHYINCHGCPFPKRDRPPTVAHVASPKNYQAPTVLASKSVSASSKTLGSSPMQSNSAAIELGCVHNPCGRKATSACAYTRCKTHWILDKSLQKKGHFWAPDLVTETRDISNRIICGDTLPEIKSFLQVDFVVETDHIGISFRGPETCRFRHHFGVTNTVPDTNGIRRSIGRAKTISIRLGFGKPSTAPETEGFGTSEIDADMTRFGNIIRLVKDFHFRSGTLKRAFFRSHQEARLSTRQASRLRVPPAPFTRLRSLSPFTNNTLITAVSHVVPPLPTTTLRLDPIEERLRRDAEEEAEDRRQDELMSCLADCARSMSFLGRDARCMNCPVLMCRRRGCWSSSWAMARSAMEVGVIADFELPNPRQAPRLIPVYDRRFSHFPFVLENDGPIPRHIHFKDESGGIWTKKNKKVAQNMTLTKKMCARLNVHLEPHTPVFKDRHSGMAEQNFKYPAQDFGWETHNTEQPTISARRPRGSKVHSHWTHSKCKRESKIDPAGFCGTRADARGNLIGKCCRFHAVIHRRRGKDVTEYAGRFNY
ncbi:hypothetical protein C8F04DRAFT_1174713 [Mycena alexandri]|uniref:Uncharacterized protein n=1 Tax=Mycena alexandri TaxID=1745969 RepID=A0AAD6X9M1_9AGAR|nr:hypothetical protein C8F04DRAFT_1174713 [Mycena alexandri]